MGISGVGACCMKPVMPWLSSGFRGMKPVMPWLAHAQCGEEALAPLRKKFSLHRLFVSRPGLDRDNFLPARVIWAEFWMFFAVRGEFCTGCGHAYRVRGEFCAGEGTLRGW